MSDSPTVGMVDEEVNMRHGRIRVRFFIPDAAQSHVEMYLPCVPSIGDHVRVGKVRYKALAASWVIEEGEFVPYIVWVNVVLAKL